METTKPIIIHGVTYRKMDMHNLYHVMKVHVH